MFRVFCLAFCVHCWPLLTATAQDTPGNSSQPSNTVQPPNIVLVITDDQGYPVIGRHGHPWIRTPHLDALHDSSTRFTRFLVSPTCKNHFCLPSITAPNSSSGVVGISQKIVHTISRNHIPLTQTMQKITGENTG